MAANMKGTTMLSGAGSGRAAASVTTARRYPRKRLPASPMKTDAGCRL
jgi:hypothetical protein